MSIANPTYLHQFLQELQARPKKSLSQNFLIDQNIVAKIIKSLSLQQGETVLEIGPGPGALTELLVESGSPVIVIEKDRTFAKALARFSTIEIFEGDFFDFDLTKVPKGSKVVSNLPYHLTSPILTTLLPQYERFKTLTLMMQKEVGLRLMAKVGSSDYSSLTLFREFYADILDFFIVRSSCFYPRPKIDSMVVTFGLRPPPEGIDVVAFFAATRAAFSQRRKMVRVSLKELYGEQLGTILERACVEPTARAETLTIEDYQRIASAATSLCILPHHPFID